MRGLEACLYMITVMLLPELRLREVRLWKDENNITENITIISEDKSSSGASCNIHVILSLGDIEQA